MKPRTQTARIKLPSRRELAIMLAQARFERIETRAACGAKAEKARQEGAAACGADKAAEATAKGKRGAAWVKARGSFKRAAAKCPAERRAAAAAAPKGEKRAAGKAARSACRQDAREVEARERKAYRGAKASHETAKGQRQTVCGAARKVKGETFEACDAPARERFASARRRVELLEAERRDEAKRSRGGRRPPVSPAERAQEEIGRAYSDLGDYPDGYRTLFEQRSNWFLREWARAVKSGRRLSLAEFVAWWAHEHEAEVENAAQVEADRWLQQEIAKQAKKWRTAA